MEAEHERIRAYCDRAEIPAERIRFIGEPSQVYLPKMDLGGTRLDFVLLDGSHAFPTPIVDFFFANMNLRIGGMLAIDDLPIPSVGIVHRFLSTEPAYEVVQIDAGKTGVYRKIRETQYPNDWPDQPFNRRYPDVSYLPLWQRLRYRAGGSRTLTQAYRKLTRASREEHR